MGHRSSVAPINYLGELKSVPHFPAFDPVFLSPYIYFKTSFR
jgi:hypothetical protein